MINSLFSDYKFTDNEQTLRIEGQIFSMLSGAIISVIMVFLLFSLNRYVVSLFFGGYFIIAIFFLLTFKKNTKIISSSTIEIADSEILINTGEFKTVRLGVVGNHSYILWFVKDEIHYNLFTLKSLKRFKLAISQIEKITMTDIKTDL